MLEKFATWDAVLAHVAAGLPVWYYAPLDYRATRLGSSEVRVMRGAKIRIRPPSRDCDPFTADAGHLDRFRKEGAS